MKLTYLGPPGSGLGFQLAGMTVIDCSDSSELKAQLADMGNVDQGGIAFVDESLSEDIMVDIERINETPALTVVLLVNPAQPKHLAAHKMDQLMIQAVGSDIFSS